MEQPERDTETETDSDSEPEHDPEEESTEEEEIDEEDIDLLETQPTLYTDQDPGYVAELKRTCPPHPLFVLRWNRQPRPANNRFPRGSGGGGDQRYHSQNQRHHNYNQPRHPPQSSSPAPEPSPPPQPSSPVRPQSSSSLRHW